MSESGAGPAISVVVPVRDGAATIGRTLAALAAQELDAEYEVIVADGGSSDSTRAVVAEFGMRLIENPDGGPGAGRTLGARAAAGGVIAFTDADCEPEPGWLAAGLRALGEAELVQGRVRPARAPGPFDRTLTVESEFGLYQTANLFVRRSTLERVGGFEPLPGLELDPGEHFGEDVWFAWRCRRAGARTAFAADAVVRHAVFAREAAGFVGERVRARYFPPLLRAVPELREAFLFRRWFLSPDSALFDLAVAGLVVGALGGRRWPVAAALPYGLRVRRRMAGAPRGTASSVAAASIAADAVTFAALVAGSARARTLVL